MNTIKQQSASSNNNSNNNNSTGPSRTYFEGNRSPGFSSRNDHHGTDLDRERALDEPKQKLHEELEHSKQRRSDLLKESKQVLLEELEAIKHKTDLSKKRFEESLLASKKKLEQELEIIEKKRKAQEEIRWNRPLNGYSTTTSPSKLDGFSVPKYELSVGGGGDNDKSRSPTIERFSSKSDRFTPPIAAPEKLHFKSDSPSSPPLSTNSNFNSNTPPQLLTSPSKERIKVDYIAFP